MDWSCQAREGIYQDCPVLDTWLEEIGDSGRPKKHMAAYSGTWDVSYGQELEWNEMAEDRQQLIDSDASLCTTGHDGQLFSKLK